MRVLTFLPSDRRSADRFQFLYQGFLLGAPDQGLRGIEVNRRAFRILDKLEAISEPLLQRATPEAAPEQVVYPTGDAARALVATGGTLTLDAVEIAMLREHLGNCPWRVQAARHVVDADEFLATAPSAA